MRPNILAISASLVVTSALVSACGRSTAQLEAEQRALDNDQTLVTACTFEGVAKVSISTLSNADTAGVCDKMARIMGRNPSVKLLRHLSKAVSSLSLQGHGNDMVGNAYQFMRVAENRGQLDDDDRMGETFEVVFKIASGTDGRVMPRDLNIFLSSLGRGARTMSNEGLINSASMLSVMKQDQGQ